MIKRIKVQNYRCLQQFELKCADIDVMLTLGLNGVGKTTLLKVFSLFQQIASGISAVPELFVASDFSFAETKDKIMRFELDLEREGRLYQYCLALELPERFTRLRVFEESLTCDGERLYGRAVAQVSLGGSGCGFLLDWHQFALPMIQDKAGNDRIANFKKVLMGMVLVSPMPNVMGDTLSGVGSYLKMDASNLADWMSECQLSAPGSYTMIVERLKDGIFSDLVGYEFAKENEDDPRRLTLIFKKEGLGIVRSRFGTLSDGEKCEILSTVIGVKASLGMCDFCYWDEPDNFLAISEVRMLISSLRTDFERAKGQYFFSSHSLQALDAVPFEKVKVFMRDSHLESTYLRDVKELVPDSKQLEFLDLKLLSGSLYNEA